MNYIVVCYKSRFLLLQFWSAHPAAQTHNNTYNTIDRATLANAFVNRGHTHTHFWEGGAQSTQLLNIGVKLGPQRNKANPYQTNPTTPMLHPRSSQICENPTGPTTHKNPRHIIHWLQWQGRVGNSPVVRQSAEPWSHTHCAYMLSPVRTCYYQFAPNQQFTPWYAKDKNTFALHTKKHRAASDNVVWVMVFTSSGIQFQNATWDNNVI